MEFQSFSVWLTLLAHRFCRWNFFFKLSNIIIFSNRNIFDGEKKQLFHFVLLIEHTLVEESSTESIFELSQLKILKDFMKTISQYTYKLNKRGLGANSVIWLNCKMTHLIPYRWKEWRYPYEIYRKYVSKHVPT